MAEPARKLPEEDRPVTRPDLRALEGGSEGHDIPQEGLKEARGDSAEGELYNASGDRSESPSADVGDQGSTSETAESLKESKSKPGGQPGGLWKPNRKETTGIAKVLFKNRKGLALGFTGTLAVISVIVGLFLGLSSLSLANFMANLEQKAFGRYQVDLSGRSSKWIETYMMLRFAEVEDSKVAPKDRNNILFRATRVDKNKPLTDWYRTMRASKFEQDLFEKKGIKFASIAYQDGNMIRFRPAKITINEDTIEVLRRSDIPFSDVSPSELEGLTGDVNKLNGRMQDFIQIEKIDNDKAARKEIKKVLKEAYPRWWRGVKRYHIRNDIQNMIGVRKWSLFENKRTAAKEKAISTRNTTVQKVVNNALPEDSKSGKFIECLFGLSDCTATTDPSNPKSKVESTGVPDRQPDKTETGADGKPILGADGKPIPVGNGDVNATVKSGSEAAAAAGKSVRELLPTLFKGANIASMIDALSRFDDALTKHRLSKLVVQAKTQYVVGLYTTLKIADDQFKTGEMSSEDVSDFMKQYGNLTNNEGWQTAIKTTSSSSLASAASTTFTEAKDKKEFCSESHQEAMAKPENKAAAEKEFQFQCPEDKIGSPNNSTWLEAAWITGPGVVLHPVLNAYKNTLGIFSTIFNKIVGAISGAVLAVTGLSSKVEEVVSYGAQKALKFGGANLDINQQTPSGRVGLLSIEGGGSLAEASLRDQGAASTTSVTRALATKNYIAYQTDKQQSDSLFERYLALSNPQSLVASQIGNASSLSFASLVSSAFSSFESLLGKSFSSLFSSARADVDDGYSVARFADIETYDLPKECLDTAPVDMTPQNSTNADDMGIFTAAELNWDMMSSKTKWYDALYEKVGDDEAKAKKVWNCALFDNTVRGGIGAVYGYKGEGALDTDSSSTTTSTGGTSIPSGNSKELAKQLVDSGKLTDQDGRYMAQIKAIANGDTSCNVNPAILAMLVGVVVNDGHRVQMSSLNRKCTGVLTASGTSSFHYASEGGHAIDVVSYDGQPVDGKNANTVKYLEEASKYLPKKTGYGQVIEKCHSGFKTPAGSYDVPDDCDHQHIQVPVKQAN